MGFCPGEDASQRVGLRVGGSEAAHHDGFEKLNKLNAEFRDAEQSGDRDPDDQEQGCVVCPADGEPFAWNFAVSCVLATAAVHEISCGCNTVCTTSYRLAGRTRIFLAQFGKSFNKIQRVFLFPWPLCK